MVLLRFFVISLSHKIFLQIPGQNNSILWKKDCPTFDWEYYHPKFKDKVRNLLKILWKLKVTPTKNRRKVNEEKNSAEWPLR